MNTIKTNIGEINMKIEGYGNTKEQAENMLENKRNEVNAQGNYSFGEIRVYGYYEIGYKLTQDYWTEI